VSIWLRSAGTDAVLRGNAIALWYLSVSCFRVIADRRESMLTRMKRLLGWIFGPLFAIAIVLAVHFFERGLRLEIRRDPAWRSH
jgi:hypothetical protein